MLLGTWKGALESEPITFLVFGDTSQGIKAEVALERPNGMERWTLYGQPGEEGSIIFEHPEGLPTCYATIEGDRMFGRCSVSSERNTRQWLVVRM